MNYQTNIDLHAVAKLLQEQSNIVITTHAKPDGDALGAVVALGEALRQMGKTVDAWLVPPVGANLRSIRGAQHARDFKEQFTLAPEQLLVIVDTGAYSQLGPMRRLIEGHLERTLVIDHHLSGDVPAKWHHVDGAAAACCEIIAELVELLGQQVNQDLFTAAVCDALFVGIASDTGWFRFSNTRPRTHELAARLLRRGVDHAELYARLEQTDRHEKLLLLSRALGDMRLLAQGRVALMVLRAADFIETGALLEETERLIDFPQTVASVQMAILISEPPDTDRPRGDSPQRRSEDKLPGSIRISFRSKPGPGTVNVADLAQQFGGGGHARAAGAKVTGNLDDVVDQVARAATAAMAG